jgi:hypothetical protein
MDRVAALALASSYVYDRLRVNRVGIPPGWQLAQFANGEQAYKSGDALSFSAGAFIDEDGKLVIAFTGINGGLDSHRQLPSGLAQPSPQILHALKLRADVVARYTSANGDPPQVTSTGHSLGEQCTLLPIRHRFSSQRPSSTPFKDTSS